MMEKSQDAFRTIGEMADELGVRTHILRYWEEQFPMLKPLKRAGGRRLYRVDDVTMLHTINRLLNTEGYTIKGARKFLTSQGAGTILPVAAMAAEATECQYDLGALRAIRNRLSAALAAA